MKRPMKRQQSGFTLVEIAIVLVIIGLLLGGVLKGQELINSARAKAMINDFRNTATMIAAYQDRFRALPGDDAGVVAHLGATAVLATTPAVRTGGLIDGDWDSVVLTDESLLLWQHLRLANLTGGNSAAPAAGNIADWPPRNAEGGRIGVQGATPIAGWPGRMFICQNNVSGRIAQQIDTTMDDGNAATGSVRFGAWATPVLVPAVPVVENTLYVACASF
ncbi:prepilin-type N-terminal cleavage/methylation domain-containing protein [Uliginosibacterium flavum]|uniref:Prepilin-type N-terminal cleavage/methylation domain-containing protein n=1 Tax=Uliginosibacterium flavum TaxID=1396831 RepID=A0ABV2TS74_9RHOO